MNDNLLYHPSDLDIRAVLREQADQLIETLDLPEIEVILEDENGDLLDMDTEKLLEEQLHGGNTQLPTPLSTSSDETTLSVEPTISTSSNDEALLAALGNQALHGNEILGNFDSRNIIQGSRTQRSTYMAALG